MRKTGAMLLTLVLVLGVAAQHGYSQISPRPAGLSGNNTQPATPFKIFDNLYYVGLDFVCSYVIQTSDGLILIDTLFENFWDTPAKGMQQLGLNPRDVKYIIISHGHDDHYAGLKKFKAEYAPNARVMMAEGDWTLMENTLRRQGPEAIAAKGVPRDIVVKDGDELKLGNTTIKMYVTPGHTEGTLSLAYNVTEAGKTYKVFYWSGPTLQSRELPMMEKFLATVKRLETLTKGTDVFLHSHPWSVSFFQKYEKFKNRRPGDPNPYVNPGEVPAFLKQRRDDTEKRIAEARAGGNREGNN